MAPRTIFPLSLSRPRSATPDRRQEELQDRINRLGLPVRVRVSPRAKRIALRLDNAHHVMHLVVPPRFTPGKAEQFVEEHRHWIRQKLAELPEPIAFVDGAVIPVLGRQRTLAIFYDKTLKTTSIDMKDNEILISTNKTDPAARLTRFLKNEARATLDNLTREKAALIDKPVKAVQIRDTKSRWGSCGPDGRISLSWRLIFAPWEAMDYVVAHEVAHLVHMDHSQRFWALCTELSTDFATGKGWMRRHGHELMRYG